MKLAIVVCSAAKTEEEFRTRPVYPSLQAQQLLRPNDVEVIVFPCNTKGLPEVYNCVLRDEKVTGKMVLFVHDDVELEDLFLYEKLKETPYSITGLAGTKSFDRRVDRCAWHLCSSREDFVGEVAHVQNRRVWTTVFGPTYSRALIVDGLFIACKVDDLRAKDVTFDENFSFHHYDITFCLRAHQNKVTCGVLPIRVVHHGLGDSMNSPEWIESNRKFKELYYT